MQALAPVQTGATGTNLNPKESFLRILDTGGVVGYKPVQVVPGVEKSRAWGLGKINADITDIIANVFLDSVVEPVSAEAFTKPI